MACKFKYNALSGELDITGGAGGGGSSTLTHATDSGNAVPAADTITIAGGTGVNTSGAGSTVTVNLDSPVLVANGGTGVTSITDNAIIIGDGTNAVDEVGPLTNGQLLIGSTGAAPVAATLTEGTGIDITNGAGSITVDVDITELPTIANSYAGDSGTATPALNVLTVAGGNGITTSAAGSTVTIDLDAPVTVPNGGTGLTSITDGGLLIGSGTGAITVTPQPTNGQILVGSTGVDPVLTTLTDGTGITITEGAGSITIDAAVAVPTSFPTDSGTATPAANALTVAGGTGINTSGSGSTVTVNLDSPVLVANGGTGTTSLTDGGILIGSGTGAVTVTGQPTNGQVLIGSTGVDPVLATLTAGSGVTITEGAGSITIAASASATPAVFNLGIDYTAGTFTVQGADATLSASNPASITLQSKADPGELVSYTIEADQNFIDDAGASEIIGNLFGVTTGVAWDEDLPFFLYAVANDDEDDIQFMISRDPRATVSPPAANIGAPDDAVADAQADFWSLDNITETEWDSNPCLCVGSFRMQMSASNDWTVQTLANNDGIGQFNDGQTFIMPLGQNASAANTFITTTGGTEPIFSSTTTEYTLDRNGFIDYNAVGLTATTAGVGTNQLGVCIPARSVRLESQIFGVFIDDSASNTKYTQLGRIASGAINIADIKGQGSSSFTTLAAVQLNDDYAFRARYKAY